MLTPTDLASLATAVYGSQWQSPLSRDLPASLRQVQRWARDGVEKPTTAQAVRAFLEERRRVSMPPPTTTGDDRDDEARDVLEPKLAALVSVAADAGWHEAELLAAMLSYAIDRMIDGAGAPAAAEVLKAALAQAKARTAS